MTGYTRFFAMIATSTVVMYAMMYLNTYSLEHVYYSQTRLWMALYMGAMMAVVMLLFMWRMYDHGARKWGILIGSAAVFAVSLYMLRSQAWVEDVAWMRAMIPHHSIAILTSERADLSDPRVQELASGIIDTQRKEIAEMKALIADLTR